MAVAYAVRELSICVAFFFMVLSGWGLRVFY